VIATQNDRAEDFCGELGQQGKSITHPTQPIKASGSSNQSPRAARSDWRQERTLDHLRVEDVRRLIADGSSRPSSDCSNDRYRPPTSAVFSLSIT